MFDTDKLAKNELERIERQNKIEKEQRSIQLEGARNAISLFKAFPAAANRIGLEPKNITIKTKERGLLRTRSYMLEKAGWELLSFRGSGESTVSASLIMYTDSIFQIVGGTVSYSKYFSLDMAAEQFWNVSDIDHNYLGESKKVIFDLKGFLEETLVGRRRGVIGDHHHCFNYHHYRDTGTFDYSLDGLFSMDELYSLIL